MVEKACPFAKSLTKVWKLILPRYCTVASILLPHLRLVALRCWAHCPPTYVFKWACIRGCVSHWLLHLVWTHFELAMPRMQVCILSQMLSHQITWQSSISAAFPRNRLPTRKYQSPSWLGRHSSSSTLSSRIFYPWPCTVDSRPVQSLSGCISEMNYEFNPFKLTLKSWASFIDATSPPQSWHFVLASQIFLLKKSVRNIHRRIFSLSQNWGRGRSRRWY